MTLKTKSTSNLKVILIACLILFGGWLALQIGITEGLVQTFRVVAEPD